MSEIALFGYLKSPQGVESLRRNFVLEKLDRQRRLNLGHFEGKISYRAPDGQRGKIDANVPTRDSCTYVFY